MRWRISKASFLASLAAPASRNVKVVPADIDFRQYVLKGRAARPVRTVESNSTYTKLWESVQRRFRLHVGSYMRITTLFVVWNPSSWNISSRRPADNTIRSEIL